MTANALTIDVEDWFHILDSDAVPSIDRWDCLESRVEHNVNRLLELLAERNVRSTMFWLGWVAKRHPRLVRAASESGHEIASHGFNHLLAYQVGRSQFFQDARDARLLLEDLTGYAVTGYRAAGFGIKSGTEWAFDAIREAGYTYDSSVFPAARGHGGLAAMPRHPFIFDTPSGELIEIPNSVVEILGSRLSLFGGGYLRLFPLPLIRWGVRRLHVANQPLIIYVHPREIDTSHPRLELPLLRRFKCYVNLDKTEQKLRELSRSYSFSTMQELSEDIRKSDVMHLSTSGVAS